MVKRILKYAVASVVIFLVLSVISIVKNWEYISNYFSNAFYTYGGVALYIAIILIGIALMIKSLFK